MIELMLIEIFAQALILCLVLYIVARHEADYSFPKVAMVTAGITVGTLLVETLAKPYLGVWTFIPSIGFIAFMLMTFCWTTLGKSLVVVALFVLVHMGFAFGIAAFQAKYMPPDAGMGAIKPDEETLELQKELGGLFGVPDGQSPSEEPAPAPAEADPEPPAPQDPPREPKPPAAATETPPLPDTEVGDPAETGWDAAKKQLVIGGIMAGSDGKYVATIDGRVAEPGDTIIATHGDVVYRWQVKAITSRGISLEPLSSTP